MYFSDNGSHYCNLSNDIIGSVDGFIYGVLVIAKASLCGGRIIGINGFDLTRT